MEDKRAKTTDRGVSEGEREEEAMLIDSLPKPAFLEGSVECEVRSPSSTIQINSYHWKNPRETVFKPDTPIINVVLSRRSAGNFASYLEASGLEPSRVGDILFMPPNYTLHSRIESGEQRSMCCVLDASVDDLFELDWEDRKLGASLDVDNGFVRSIMMRLAREALEPQFASALLIESLSIALAVELRRHFDLIDRHDHDAPRQGALTVDQLRRVRERIEQENASNPVTVASLAQSEGMSVRHFFRRFQASTGQSVSEYTAHVRIERAKSLLTKDHCLIKEVAYQCGFQSSSSFSSAFRRATSLTPQQYRSSTLN